MAKKQTASKKQNDAEIPVSNEEKISNFKRIAQRRVQKLLKAISTLGNCGNKNVYTYTDEQVEKIFSTIASQLSETKKKFAPKEKKTFEEFVME